MLNHHEVMLAARAHLENKGFPAINHVVVSHGGTVLDVPLKDLVYFDIGAQLQLVSRETVKQYVAIKEIAEDHITLITKVINANSGVYNLRCKPKRRGYTSFPVKDISAEDWTLREDYLPGPSFAVTVGNEEIEYSPMYVVRIEGTTGGGEGAVFKFADSVLAAFKPGMIIPLRKLYKDARVAIQSGKFIRKNSSQSWITAPAKELIGHESFAVGDVFYVANSAESANNDMPLTVSAVTESELTVSETLIDTFFASIKIGKEISDPFKERALRVRSSPGPFRSQLVRIDSRIGTTITIPLIIRQPNN